jgi:molybdenum cofactor cytidylyltransferase
MTALIILAAGGSSRLGQPKQNLLFNGQTLLQHAVLSGKRSKCEPIVVVLGANAEKIKPISGTIILYNKDWEEGMASSIRTAIKEIQQDLSVDEVIIMLCDQPFVSAALLDNLIDKQIETDKPIVACAYKSTIGVPVLFKRMLFAELLSLQGQEGAKKILKDHSSVAAVIPFEQGSIDIDTPEDYKQLLNLSD